MKQRRAARELFHFKEIAANLKCQQNGSLYFPFFFFYVLLTVYLTIFLGNDQLDTQLLYFTIRLL